MAGWVKVREQFFRQSFGVALLMVLVRYLTEQLLSRKLGQVSQAKAQVGFQVANVG